MIEIVNYSQFAGGLEARLKKMSIMVEAAVAKSGKDIEKNAANNTPTGHPSKGLKKAWQSRPDGKWAYKIYNEKEYAIYVENGFMLTKKSLAAMAAQGINLPESGAGVPRFILGRHMLANAMHTALPIMKRNVNFAIKQVVA